MYAVTITRLLEMCPAGLTAEQLLWHLRKSGLRPGADEIALSLTQLMDTGVARLTPGGRWRVARYAARDPLSTTASDDGRAQSPVSTPSGGTVLRAVPAAPARRPEGTAGDLPEEEPDPVAAPRADGDWRLLLAYYAATQRLDPRGVVNERADRHGTAWQLVCAPGTWWQAPELRLSVQDLPPELREALAHSPNATCSIGYPIGVFDDTGVPGIMPALLLPALYRLEGPQLVVEFTAAAPTLNPRWLEAVVRRVRGWSRDGLVAALFPEGESDRLDDVVARIANAVATLGGRSLRPADLERTLVVAGEGLHNAAALFLPTDAAFTRGAARDLDAIRAWGDAEMGATALGPLLRAPDAETASAPGFVPCGPRVLTDRQYDAAAGALHGPLALIQGPPGTGKSEVILTLLASIVLQGGSALLVSKNHRALDEVEERLAPLIGDVPLLTRARDGDGERDSDFIDALKMVVDGQARCGIGVADTDTPAALIARARQVWEARARARRIEALHVELSAAVERRAEWDAALPEGSVPSRRVGRWARLRARLRRRRAAAADGPANRAALDRRIEALRRDLVQFVREDESRAALDSEAIAAATKDALHRLAARIVLPDAAARAALDETLARLKFENRAKPSRMTGDEARQVLRHRPTWAVSALSAAARIPLLPALFDVVIFDEASQCDIASALPLFARARRAVVVGDPMQLGFIPQLSLHQERALMDAAGLGPAGRHEVAQSKNSLFDFMRRRNVPHRHFLADQFRSDPAIVAYLNDAFYEGRLIAAQDNRRSRWPDGYRPGLDWHDVRGTVRREDGGNVNHAEADAIVRLLACMIRERRFAGSVTVLSPFNAQVALLHRRIRAALTEAELSSVRVSTIDRAQGSEADVVLFSIVVAPGVHAGALQFYERERRRLNVAISRARALCLVVGDRAFARTCRVGPLAFLAEAPERHKRPRDGFDSEWERRLHAALKRRGLDAISQYPVGSRYLDLAIDPEGRKLDVEVDGRRWHTDEYGNRKLADRLRDQEMIARGWTVRRFWVHELHDDMEKCVGIVERDFHQA